MHDYQFNFIAKSLIEVIRLLAVIVQKEVPDYCDWENYNQLESIYSNWHDKKDKDDKWLHFVS